MLFARMALTVCALSLGPAAVPSAQDTQRATIIISATVQPSCRVWVDGRDIRLDAGAAVATIRVHVEGGALLAIDF